MAESSITRLLVDYEVDVKKLTNYAPYVDGKNGWFYGIPGSSSPGTVFRAIKYNPIDKELIHFGPDLAEFRKNVRHGVLANNGCIYYPPSGGRVVKIDIVHETAVAIDVPLEGVWFSCALSLDGNIYCMPHGVGFILKINPDNDSFSKVGNDFSQYLQDASFSGSVAGNDGCIYGLPWGSESIIKYDPAHPETTFPLPKKSEGDDLWAYYGGVLADDGNIYGLTVYNQVLKIDTKNYDYSLIGEKLYDGNNDTFGHPILGPDKCIYWTPNAHQSTHVRKFDPATQQMSLVGDNLKDRWVARREWVSGIAASDGKIYCIPTRSMQKEQILEIDPRKEFLMASTKIENNVQRN